MHRFKDFSELETVRELFKQPRKKVDLEHNSNNIDYLKNFDEDTIADLIFYLKAQERTDDAFAIMTYIKKEIKSLDSADEKLNKEREHAAAKIEWETAKKELAAYKLTDDLSELAPNEIDNETAGHPTLKVIRKLNLGTLNRQDRKVLIEGLEAFLGQTSQLSESSEIKRKAA